MQPPWHISDTKSLQQARQLYSSVTADAWSTGRESPCRSSLGQAALPSACSSPPQYHKLFTLTTYRVLTPRKVTGARTKRVCARLQVAPVPKQPEAKGSLSLITSEALAARINLYLRDEVVPSYPEDEDVSSSRTWGSKNNINC